MTLIANNETDRIALTLHLRALKVDRSSYAKLLN